MADDQTSLAGSCIGSNLEVLSGTTVQKLTSSAFKVQVLNADKCNSQSLVKSAVILAAAEMLPRGAFAGPISGRRLLLGAYYSGDPA